MYSRGCLTVRQLPYIAQSVYTGSNLEEGRKVVAQRIGRTDSVGVEHQEIANRERVQCQYLVSAVVPVARKPKLEPKLVLLSAIPTT